MVFPSRSKLYSAHVGDDHQNSCNCSCEKMDPSSFSVAQRMNWASSRHTTRQEDEAYCLLGLFGINMPLLYGEGRKAFRRLQEEIIRTSVDQSIFAWELPNDAYTRWDLLAPSPSYFGGISRYIVPDRRRPESEFLLTHRGLQINLRLD